MNKRKNTNYWSQEVTEKSDALDVEKSVFTWDNPKKIAESLMDTAKNSTKKKSTPFRSAMSKLTFYINRAGKNLDPNQKEILEKAKDELRRLK